jgi:hypothetical protein
MGTRPAGALRLVSIAGHTGHAHPLREDDLSALREEPLKIGFRVLVVGAIANDF